MNLRMTAYSLYTLSQLCVPRNTSEYDEVIQVN